jgi:hypothetical protein
VKAFAAFMRKNSDWNSMHSASVRFMGKGSTRAQSMRILLLKPMGASEGVNAL